MATRRLEGREQPRPDWSLKLVALTLCGGKARWSKCSSWRRYKAHLSSSPSLNNNLQIVPLPSCQHPFHPGHSNLDVNRTCLQTRHHTAPAKFGFSVERRQRFAHAHRVSTRLFPVGFDDELRAIELRVLCTSLAAALGLSRPPITWTHRSTWSIAGILQAEGHHDWTRARQQICTPLAQEGNCKWRASLCRSVVALGTKAKEQALAEVVELQPFGEVELREGRWSSEMEGLVGDKPWRFPSRTVPLFRGRGGKTEHCSSGTGTVPAEPASEIADGMTTNEGWERGQFNDGAWAPADYSTPRLLRTRSSQPLKFHANCYASTSTSKPTALPMNWHGGVGEKGVGSRRDIGFEDRERPGLAVDWRSKYD
ncbi:hypothetical protein BKA70DRAFT_1226279 [Coprinopsis sp. MPI-PUGE-AT-0042]|nr:hypothetical protein BKA70DRAFT_1226279 [Coprinopsis sp. MPI-PUGE-AT-0042]